LIYRIHFLSHTANGRAPHAQDLAFVLDNTDLLPGMVGGGSGDVATTQPPATMLTAMLIAFARTGNPNPSGIAALAGL